MKKKKKCNKNTSSNNNRSNKSHITKINNHDDSRDISIATTTMNNNNDDDDNNNDQIMIQQISNLTTNNTTNKLLLLNQNNINNQDDDNDERKSSTTTTNNNNFVLNAGNGCHIARKDLIDNNNNNWIIDWEDIDIYDYIDDVIDDDQNNYNFPDIAIDYNDEKELWILSLCNLRSKNSVVAYITIYETTLYNCNYQSLSKGTIIDEQQNTKICTTLIILCPPCTFVHLCYIDIPFTASSALSPFDYIQMENDVQIWNEHLNPNDTHIHTISFPLLSTSTSTSSPSTRSAGIDHSDIDDNDHHEHDTSVSSEHDESFLCTQGIDGILTHFFIGNLHAYDFRCPIGTLICAVGNGIVIDVQDSYHHITGIATSNLYHWNSIMIQLTENNDNDNHNDRILSASDSNKLQNAIDSSLYIEYVHIKKSYVKVGDVVYDGQMIGTTGSIGFSPEPHLHIAAYRSHDKDAPTCQIYFHKKKKKQQQKSTSIDLITTRSTTDPLCTTSTTEQQERNDDDNNDVLFLPVAGQWYNCNGLVCKDK